MARAVVADENECLKSLKKKYLRNIEEAGLKVTRPVSEHPLIFLLVSKIIIIRTFLGNFTYPLKKEVYKLLPFEERFRLLLRSENRQHGTTKSDVE